MSARRINPGLIKLNRTYDVAELATRLGVHRNTVRNWQRQGLGPIDHGRPALFHGSAIRTFLSNRSASRKSPCGLGELYCFKCRAPRTPALGMVDYVPRTATSGNVRAFCTTCETVMNRRATKATLAAILPGFDVQFVEAPQRLSGSPSPSLNCAMERQATA